MGLPGNRTLAGKEWSWERYWCLGLEEVLERGEEDEFERDVEV